MNYNDWYTDLADIYRVRNRQEGALTKQERVQVAGDVPCRVYRNSVHGPGMQPTAAKAEQEDKLACANEVDIQAGDELIVRRGARLGQSRQKMRAFAGEPACFYEPFGAVIPGLAHQELALLQVEYLRGEVQDGTG